MIVAFLGVDGSGKSTLIREVAASLGSNAEVLHLRPQALWGASGKEAVQQVTNPHGLRPRGCLASIAKVVMFAADYGAWYFRVRSSPKVFLFDRYFHDLSVDPVRYRYGGPRGFLAMVASLIPQPDLWVVLLLDPKIAQARKTEVPFAETAAQMERYRALAAGLPHSVVLDAAKPPETLAGEVVARIQERQRRAHRV